MAARQGFTLIELLTVIAIAGVLAAVSLPGLSSLKQSGSLNDGAQTLVSVLRQAQAQAIAGQGNGDHMVTFTASSPCAYKHTVGATTLSTTTAPNGVPCLEGGVLPTAVTFHKLTGAATTGSGTIDLNTKHITISSLGVISTQ